MFEVKIFLFNHYFSVNEIYRTVKILSHKSLESFEKGQFETFEKGKDFFSSTETSSLEKLKMI